MNSSNSNDDNTRSSGAYKQAGVDTAQAQKFISSITSKVEQTHDKHVLQSLGGFSGLYEIPSGYKHPVLVSCTDGVGTKLCLAIEQNQHHGIGIDLVAMCANDLVVCGGKPLYFLDYFATGKLDLSQGQEILLGIIDGCQQARMALIGGETAEMPGMYAAGHYDLAGFSVGIVERERIITGKKIKPGMHLVGLASSGLHANGFSLVRKIIQEHKIDLTQVLNGQSLSDLLLIPTKIYCQSVASIIEKYEILGMVHVTGGGFHENIPRILPENCSVTIEANSFTRPAIINWLQEISQIDETELYSVFNMGIGYILICEAAVSAQICATLNASDEPAWVIGEVTARKEPRVEIL